MTKPYKFDPHTHTSETSRCSRITAAQLVKGYHAVGFGGIAITDHLNKWYTSSFDDWDTYLDYFLRGYKAAKAHGDKIGLDVILGAEARFDSVNGEFLLYGLDEDFLRRNPNFHMLNLQKFYSRYGGEILIIQAHPYRGEDKPCMGCIHGAEAYNGNPRHMSHNKKARKLCAKHPELYPTSASDTHELGDIGAGWMEFDQPVADSRRFRELVMRREYVLERRG